MKKVSSVVWQFFDRLEENKRCVAVLCKLCDSEYKYFGNTTNLRAHLIKKHPIQWELRQNNWDGQKSVDESNIRVYRDDEITIQSPASPKRRKYTRAHKDKNVRYSLSIKAPDSSTTGADSMPKIEIQRVDVLDTIGAEPDDEENEATHHLVRQMHDQVSDEEWLEEDYLTEIYEPKRKRVHPKIKREVVTPPRRNTSYVVHNVPAPEKPGRIIIDNPRKDEYSVFGEYIANKLRKFKSHRTRGNIQQIITSILWQAEYGMYDDANAVRRVLMCTVPESEPEQSSMENEHDNIQSEEVMGQESLENNQSMDSESVETVN